MACCAYFYPARQKDIEYQQQAVLKDLTLLATYWQQHDEAELAHAALQLHQQLQQLQLTGRFEMPVDPDISLAPSGINPVLQGIISCILPLAAHKYIWPG